MVQMYIEVHFDDTKKNMGGCIIVQFAFVGHQLVLILKQDHVTSFKED
jgi:hypothetical protein